MTYPKIDKPTVPGWYWAENMRGEFEVVIVHIEHTGDPVFMGVGWIDEWHPCSLMRSFFGPLPEPTE